MIYNLNKAQDSCNAHGIKAKGSSLLELIGRDIFLRMLLLLNLLLPAGVGHHPKAMSRTQKLAAAVSIMVPTPRADAVGCLEEAVLEHRAPYAGTGAQGTTKG